MTGSAQAPAAYLLAKQVPRLLGTAPGGALSDLISPQLVVSACAIVQGAAVAGIIVAGHHRSALGIYLLVVSGQVATGMSRAAINAVLPRIVLPSSLPRSNALLQLCSNSAFAVAPILAAPLIAWRGTDVLFIADVVSFGVSAVLMASLPTLFITPVSGRRLGALSGLRIVMANATLRVLAAAYFAEGIVINLAASVFVLLAEQRLGGDSRVGLLYAAVGIGDAIGAVLVLRLRSITVKPITLLIPGLIAVLTIAFLAEAHALWSAALPLLLCGAGGVVFQTWGMAEAQRSTPREVMGRVSAVFALAGSVGLLLGAAMELVLLSVLSWDAALPICSLATATVLAAVSLLPGLRRPRPATAAAA